MKQDQVKEGESLLRKAINGGSDEAKLELGLRLIEGDCIRQNLSDGEDLLREVALREVAESGHEGAMLCAHWAFY